MKRFFIAIFATVLMMFSCTGNKANQTEEVPADSVADSIDTTDVDSMEMLITETPMPRAADAMFDDFLFNFLANKKLQKERVVFPLRVTENGNTTKIEAGDWKMEHLFMRQGYYTLLFNNDKQMQLMKDTAVNEAVVEKILLAKNQVKNYCFQRIKGAWLLREIKVTPLQSDANASFLTFYRKFVTDTAFQIKSISETVDFVGPDPDDDFNMMEGVITPDTWEAFAPELPQKMIYNIIYGQPRPEGNRKVFVLRGIANGMEVEMTFVRKNDTWKLTKLNT